jgi:hypothetical protein
MYSLAEVLEPRLQVLRVLLPGHPVDPRCRSSVHPEEGVAEELRRHVVE